MRILKYVVLVMLILGVFLLGACNPAELFETPEQDKLVVKILEGIEDGEYDDIREEFVETIPDLETGLNQISDYFEGEIEDVTKIGYYINARLNNGETTKTQDCTYHVQTNEDEYRVFMQLLSHDGAQFKILNFNVVRAEELEGNGAIINFNDFDITQLLLLVFSALCIGFMIFAIVLCAKAKIRLKALWIIIIILIQTGVSISSFPNSFKFNILLFSTNITSLRKFINGGTILTVLVPVGAILFVALRKRLIRKAALYEEQKYLQTQQNNMQTQTASEQTKLDE